MNQGEYGKALPLYERCLSQRKVVLGYDHADILKSMHDLAVNELLYILSR